MREIALSCVAALSLLASPEDAQACGATPPSYTLLTDDQGGVPAGTKVLKLYVYGAQLEQLTSAILSVDGGGGGLPVNLPVTRRIQSDWLVEIDLGPARVEAGSQYTLSLGAASGGGPDPLRFRGVHASPMPTELGQLTQRSRKSGLLAYGVCGERGEGEHAILALEPHAAAQPWVRAVSHQLFMDGQPLFRPEIPLINLVAQPQQPVVRAIATCQRTPRNDPNGVFDEGIEVIVPAGKHRMQWRSTFPNGTVFETNALDVDLRCDGAGAASSGDAGSQIEADAGSLIEADAGSPARADAGSGQLVQDASKGDAQPGVDQGPRPNDDEDERADADTGCSLGGGQNSSGAAAFALMLLMLAWRAARARGMSWYGLATAPRRARVPGPRRA